jgi:nicotinate phosphoribosyltransferase
MAERGHRLGGVRIDSGDLVALSHEVRRVLDAAGFRDVRIFASGGLDEHEIEALLARGAPVDAFGVGTRMDVSADAPYLEMAYKLVRYEGRDVLKTSTGKETWAGEKQVYRHRDADGRASHDVLALRGEPPPDGGAPLLARVMANGRRLGSDPALAAIREHCAAEVRALPAEVHRLRDPAPYPVRYSDRLVELQRALKIGVASRAE